MPGPKYSIIVPVYNRPGEVEELLASLSKQTYTNFEVIIVEDGSDVTSKHVVDNYSALLNIRYFFKQNSGPGPGRNFGFEKAVGEYLVIFDSDCIIPPDYFSIVDKYLATEPLDVWGGPDRGHGNFTRKQRAMAYSMSSTLSTGGIRGGKNASASFQPRSFNMGMSRKAYEATGGFKFDRYAEDIELSIRSKKLGLKTGLIAPAFVYHKRRATFRQFFKQVSNFGRGRIEVSRAHPGAIKLTHWFPAFFLLGLIAIPILLLTYTLLGEILAALYVIYLLLVYFDAAFHFKLDIYLSLLSVYAVVVQMVGYGSGFLKALLKL